MEPIDPTPPPQTPEIPAPTPPPGELDPTPGPDLPDPYPPPGELDPPQPPLTPGTGAGTDLAERSAGSPLESARICRKRG